MLRFMDAGESHGKGIMTIVEGMPYGVEVSGEEIEKELARRRLGYGRGGRMKLEADKVEILSGIRSGKTIGSPVAIMVLNAEYEKWKDIMPVEGSNGIDALTKPRPGHADLAGALKYGTRDIRDVLERASARETVGRVCAGAMAKMLLSRVGIEVFSHVLQIGGINAEETENSPKRDEVMKADENPVRCLDEEASSLMVKEIDRAKTEGNTLGGIFEILAFGVPPGIGSYAHWDRRLDARIAGAVMSVQAIKGVEIGKGFKMAGMRGSDVLDAINYEKGKGFSRLANNAGGIEGGMTNGEVVVVRAAMKPIPTLSDPPYTVDLASKERVKAAVERADICAVPAAAVIAESCVALVLADSMLEKTGGDSMDEIRERFQVMVRRQTDF